MTPRAEPEAPSTSKILLEFGPLAVFFVVNWWRGIFWATGLFMVAFGAALIVSWLQRKRIPPMTIFTGVIVAVFGGLTLYLQDDTFIKVKVTIINALFAAILLFGLVTRRHLLKAVLGSAFQLTPAGWHLLTVRYLGFFVTLALANEAIWRNVSTDTWVNFKVFGLPLLTLAFTIAQVPLLQRHQIEDEPEDEANPAADSSKEA